MDIPTEILEAGESGDMELFFLLTMLNTGAVWFYPEGKKRLMTQDKDTVIRWYKQGIDLKAMKGYTTKN